MSHILEKVWSHLHENNLEETIYAQSRGLTSKEGKQIGQVSWMTRKKKKKT